MPESGIELIPNETFPLEVGFERFHGVDFKKGCYVGQEVTARMKHKTELRKGLCLVTIEGAAPEKRGAPLRGRTVTRRVRTALRRTCREVRRGRAPCPGPRTSGP